MIQSINPLFFFICYVEFGQTDSHLRIFSIFSFLLKLNINNVIIRLCRFLAPTISWKEVPFWLPHNVSTACTTNNLALGTNELPLTSRTSTLHNSIEEKRNEHCDLSILFMISSKINVDRQCNYFSILRLQAGHSYEPNYTSSQLFMLTSDHTIDDWWWCHHGSTDRAEQGGEEVISIIANICKEQKNIY